VVTGVSPGGLGFETARALATKEPKLLVLATRDPVKLQKARDDILKESPHAKLASVVVDFDSVASVRKAAPEILALGNPDILINNAAVMMCPYGTTSDGFEKQFGVNYLGPWLLTNLLLPAILKTPHPRIVNVSSAGHRYSDIRFDDPGFSEGKAYHKRESYGQSKTANMLHALELSERYGKDGLVAISLHPGAIMTNLSRHATEEDLALYKAFLNPDLTPNMSTGLWKSIPEGAATTLTAALDPRMDDINGGYLADSQLAKPDDGKLDFMDLTKISDYGKDKKGAKKLWALTNSLLKTDF